MKRILFLTFLSVFLFANYGKSQSPGGVSSNHLKLWLKANSIAAANGAVLGTWNDNSPKAYNATQAHIALPDSAPNYEDNAVNNINFNPSVLFNGTTGFMNLLGSNGAADPAFVSNHDNKYTNYTVIQPDPSYALGTAANPGKFFFSGTAGPDDFTSGDVRTTGELNDSWNQDDNISPGGNYQSYPILVTFTYDSASDTRTIFTYGSSISTNIFGFQATNTGNKNYGIGCQLSANPHLEFYKGTIAEMVSYTKSNHAGTNSKKEIESYLAIKYGLTLTGENYLSSAATVIWNMASGAADYNKNIIGLGRDDNSGLMQKQSFSSGGMPNFNPDLLTIFIGPAKTVDNASNTGTFLAGDKSFFMVGCDTTPVCGPLSAPHDAVPAGICCRIVKQWFTQITNFTNTDVTLEFNLPACASVNLVAANLRLLVDDDGNFNNAVPLNIVAGTGPALTSITVAGSVVDIKLPASYFTSNAGYTDAKVHPYFTLGSITGTPLPMELMYFNANLQEDKTVLCKWETQSETNNATFTVEKSADGVNFETVTTLPGAGTTSQTHYYSAMDDNPYIGISYYRLKQTDYDGQFTYSNLAPITYYPTDEISIGNVRLGSSNSFIQIVSKSEGEANIDIFDVTGRKIYASNQNMVAGINNVCIASNFTKGVYILHVTSASGSIAQKKVLAWK
jgi:hypothetical protein